MARKQFLALSKQILRHTLDETPAFIFYPVQGSLEPKPDYKEEPTKEWRGADTAQGDVTDDRTSTSWSYPLEARIYPCAELVELVTFLMGVAPTPAGLSAPNAAANRYIFSTITEIYGEGASLEDQALAFIPNTAKGSTTYSQSFLGGRPFDAELAFKGGEAAMLKMNFKGGPWIGAPEQTETAGMSFTALKAFRSVPKLYIGTGATLTGTAPDYTDFVPGTMKAAKPDDLTIKMEQGSDDVFKMNGYDGPSETERNGQWKITIEGTFDFSDPSTGWSSYDAWVARFTGAQYAPVMITLDGPEVLPSCESQKGHLALYLPKMKLMNEPVDRKNDGSKDKVKFTLESRVDTAVNVCAFLKLIL